MKEKRLPYELLYQPCWISYLGAVSGVMQALGKLEHDLVSTGGYTGYAFALPNVMKNCTCPSGPTSLGEMWNEILTGTKSLGYETTLYNDPICFPAKGGELTEIESQRAKKMFETVKTCVDKAYPIVLWGLPIPEYGIVTGYQDNFYLASTYRRLIKQPEESVHYESLQAPGGLHTIIFKEKKTDTVNNLDKISLQRAITLANGNLREEGYIAGVQAYIEWANVLENAPEKDVIYHGNAYMNECTLEAKEIACAFLQRLAEKYPEESFSIKLQAVGMKYQKVVEQLKEFQKLFPFAMEGVVSKEKRLEGAKVLRNAIPVEEEALKLMKDALSLWK